MKIDSIKSRMLAPLVVVGTLGAAFLAWGAWDGDAAPERLSSNRIEPAASESESLPIADQGLDSDPLSSQSYIDLACREPVRTLAWADGLEPGEVRSRAIVDVVYAWSMADPVAALAGIDAQLKGGDPDRLAAATSAIVILTSHDALEAWKWLRARPPSLERDEQSLAFVRDAKELCPEIALEASASIFDGSSREQGMYEVIDEWWRNDGAQAAEWISRNEALLTPGLERRILQLMEDTPPGDYENTILSKNEYDK